MLQSRLIFAVLFLSVPLSVAFGQEPLGVIRGVVMDQTTQEYLPAANVQILGTTLGASTDINGEFLLPAVPAGVYQLRVSLIGYDPRILSDVVVNSAKPTELMVKLVQEALELDAVEVRAGYFQKAPDQAVSVQRLSNEEIRRSPGGFEDVVRAVSVLPGVAQVQNGRNDLAVRGGAPSENLYLIDNIEVPNINHFGTRGASGGALGYVNLDFVRETSFSSGGFGVKYGDRLSSVLDIDIRNGRTDRLGGKATVSATQFGLNLEGPLGGSGDFLFSARRSYLDFIFKSAGFSFVPAYWDFLGRASFRLDPRNDITVLGIGIIDQVEFFNSTPEDRYNNSRILGNSQWQYVTGFTWRHLMDRGILTASLGRTFTHFNAIQNDSLLNPIFTNVSDESETSLRADAVLKVAAATEVSFGTQVKRARLATDLLLPAYVTTFGDTISSSIQGLDEIGYKGGAYGQVSHRLFDRLQITAGLRVDYFSVLNRQWYAGPRASFSYEFSPLWTLTGSAGVYHQNPSYIWLASDSRNRDLQATRVDQYILGLEHFLRADLKVRIEGFRKQYRDYPASVDRPYLVLANTGGGYGGAEDNFASYGLDHLVSEGSGNAYGIEFFAQKKMSEIPLYGLISLTLSRTRYTALDGVSRAGSYDQSVLFTLSGGYRFDAHWEASTRFRYATGRPYTPFNSDGSQNVSAYNSLRVDPLHSLDLRVDRRWNFTTWSLIAYLDIQNVYNNKQSDTVRWNAQEQKVEDSRSAIGILPAIGISAEF